MTQPQVCLDTVWNIIIFIFYYLIQPKVDNSCSNSLTHHFTSLANYQILFKLFPPSSQKKSTIYETLLKLEARAIASFRTSFSSNGAIHVGHHERFKRRTVQLPHRSRSECSLPVILTLILRQQKKISSVF